MSESTSNKLPDGVFIIRGQVAMLDTALAISYGVTAEQISQAVKANPGRFTDEFACILTDEEISDLKQSGRCDGQSPAIAFTITGLMMLATVLSGKAADQMAITLVRGFKEMQKLSKQYDQLGGKVEALRRIAQAVSRPVQLPPAAFVKPPGKLPSN